MDNIAIIITKLNGGGAERCAANLSIELSKQYNVFLIVFDGRDISYPYGGKLIDLNIPDSFSSIKRYINVLKRANLVRKIKKENNISCSISLLDGPNLVNALSRCGEKTIVSIRNRLSREYVNKLRRKLIIFSSTKTDLTVCLSKMVEKDMHEFFGIPRSKLTTIYNHVDAQLLHDLVHDSVKPDFINDTDVYITTMGRLNEQKGQWHLIRAFQLVLKSIPQAKLVIIGEGELKEELKKLAKSLSLEDKVIFTGYIKNPHNILLYSEVFVFPSLFEGLGNVLLEALAFDMPIVSTDCIAGPREILAPDTDLNTVLTEVEYAKYGVLVPALDKGLFNSKEPLSSQEICLANAIIDLHKNKALRETYRNNARERLKAFEKERIIEQWKAIF